MGGSAIEKEIVSSIFLFWTNHEFNGSNWFVPHGYLLPCYMVISAPFPLKNRCTVGSNEDITERKKIILLKLIELR